MSRFALLPMLAEWRRDPIGWLSRMSTTTDPIAAPRLGYPMRIVFDPELAGEVLVADAASYTRPWLVTSTMRDGLGRTLFTATGPGALAQRRLLAPVFARAHGDELAGLMSATIDDELARWPAGPIADLQGPLTDLTLRVAARALLGVDTGDDDRGRRLRDEFSIVIEWINHRFNRLFSPPAIVPTPRNRAMLRARSELRTIVHGVIADRRATKASSMDVLALLLDHQARTGDLSDDHIVNECIGFLFAGHETTASTLAWALYSLAVAPEMQQRVAAEGDALQGRPSAAAVDALHYTGQVVEETLRLYPAGVGIARMARCATTLAGQRIRRGTIVAIPVYSIQRDPRRWTAPDTFDPDRFRAGAVSPRGGHLPFGWGPRACLGARFATMEARLALTMITARWRVTFTGERAPEQKISPALRMADGLPVYLEIRARQGQRAGAQFLMEAVMTEDRYVWVTTRRLMPGTLKDFEQAWRPERHPDGMIRAFAYWSPDGREAIGVSFWDSKESCDRWRASEAEAHRRDAMSAYVEQESETFYTGRELQVP